jgi:hypothetical protein
MGCHASGLGVHGAGFSPVHGENDGRVSSYNSIY